MRLDRDTADRILQGLVDPADAPPGYEAVVRLLAAVRAPHAAVSTTTIMAGRGPVNRPRGRFMLASPPFRSRLAIVATTVALGAASTTAYAAGLPAAASATAQGVLQSLGVTAGHAAPAKSQPSGTHGAEVSTLARTTTATGSAKGAAVAALAGGGRSRAGAQHDTTTEKGDAGSGKGAGHGHGAEISQPAHSTTGTAGAKGATISTAASGGKSHAGEHGHDGASGGTHGKAPTAGSHGQGGDSGRHGSGKGPGKP